jgi:hypothetical protein
MADREEYDGYPHEQSCATCVWRGGWDEGAGKLGSGQQYCHEPRDLDAAGKPRSCVHDWLGCNRHKAFPPGQAAREWYPDEGYDWH